MRPIGAKPPARHTTSMEYRPSSSELMGRMPSSTRAQEHPRMSAHMPSPPITKPLSSPRRRAVGDPPHHVEPSPPHHAPPYSDLYSGGSMFSHTEAGGGPGFDSFHSSPPESFHTSPSMQPDSFHGSQPDSFHGSQPDSFHGSPSMQPAQPDPVASPPSASMWGDSGPGTMWGEEPLSSYPHLNSPGLGPSATTLDSFQPSVPFGLPSPRTRNTVAATVVDTDEHHSLSPKFSAGAASFVVGGSTVNPKQSPW